MNSQAQERIHGPDVLRGLAALGVVLFHVLYLSGIPINDTAAAITGRMDFFVRVFFVLSAFAIGHAYHSRMNSTEAIKIFYQKRFFRIAPLFYFMILTGVVFRLAMYQPMPPFLDFILSGSFLFTLLPGKQSGLVGGGWSIGIEWLFYFMFPMLLSTIRTAKSAAFAWVVLCLIATLSKGYLQESFDGQLNEFASLNVLVHSQYFILGLLILHLSRAGMPTARNAIQHQAVGIAFLALLACTIYSLHAPFGLPEEVLLSIAAPLMVGLSIAGFPRWLDNKATRWLGLVSYSTYLVQFPLIQLLQMHGIYAEIDEHVGHGGLAFATAALVTLACVVVIAAFTYYFVELPGQRLYDKLRGGRLTPRT